MTNALPAVDAADQIRLVGALRNPAAFGALVDQVAVIETHISYVLLTGEYAYKIKKAIDLGFLDYTTLALRRAYCETELRLNRRLAPAIYLDVVAITGTIDAPVVGGNGPALEYAVRMREFPQEALLSRVLARNELPAATIDALAAEVASFHARIDTAAPDGAFGAPDDIFTVAADNLAQIRALQDDAPERLALDALSDWTRSEFTARAEAMRQRRRDGFVRECHGDLHLGNVALVDGAITIFDCIEFNEQLRWIDVMSEVAFVVMDLMDRGHPNLAHRFLNAYLEITGDYGGLAVLPFYLCYRAMVRAKVACLRAAQLESSEARDALVAEHRSYLELARRFTRPLRPGIIVAHGLSGSGKTTLSQSLLERIGAVRIRTDVERKRLHGLAAGARSGSGIDRGLYTADATRETYRRACGLVRDVIGAGWIAIVDGTFLMRWQRDLFRRQAAELGVPFVVIDFAAGETTVRERLRTRGRDGHDASEADIAVLEHQLSTQEPLAPDEAASVVGYDAGMPFERSTAPGAWADVIERLGIPPP
jgi:aminoglycoside phosphotransferase family enzyme/predicted kinase